MTKVKTVKIDDIKPYANNPRQNDGEAIDQVADSIKTFGWQQPIVVDKDMVIIVGETRYKAAKKLNLTSVPITVATNLTPTMAKQYRIADNRVGEYSDWDDDKLASEFEELGVLPFSMELPLKGSKGGHPRKVWRLSEKFDKLVEMGWSCEQSSK